jgi:hypothetical protein
MDATPRYGIPPEAPEQPQSHPDRDLDIIIKLLREIKIFMEEYIQCHLQYLVHDGLDNLVLDFKQQIPILSQNTKTVISILSEQPSTFDYTTTKTNLENAALTGAPLKAKDKSLRGHMNRFYKYLEHGTTKVLRNMAGAVFKVANSLLGSLKEAVATTLPIVGSAIEAIKQIKEHVEAASTGPPTE